MLSPRLVALNLAIVLLAVFGAGLRTIDVLGNQRQAEREYFPVEAVQALIRNDWRRTDL